MDSDVIGGVPADGDYAPYAVGNSWSYQVTEAENGAEISSSVETLKITGSEPIRGRDAWVVSRWDQSQDGPFFDGYYLRDASGLFFYGPAPDNPAEPVPHPILKFPLKAGDGYRQAELRGISLGRDLDEDGIVETLRVSSRVTVLGFEGVQVAGGTFEHCVKIRTAITETVTLSSNGRKATIVGSEFRWYAPDVGLVRLTETYSAPGWSSSRQTDLIAYHVGERRSESEAPSILMTVPGGIAATRTRVAAYFSEEMDPSTMTEASFTLHDSEGRLIPGVVSYADREASFDPVNPLPDGPFTATVSTLARDLAGNRLPEARDWHFTVDAIAPTITSRLPDRRATVMELSTTIRVVFSEDMDPSTVNAQSFVVSSSEGSVPGTITYADRVATFTPAGELAKKTTYYVQLRGMTDLVGNSLADFWTFTTVASPLFPSYSVTATGSRPEALAIGDVNGDGRNDVVLITSSYFDAANDYRLFVFLQDEAGALRPPIKYPLDATYSDRPSSVAIGDINHDGRNDVVVGNSGNIQVFLQDGAGELVAGAGRPTPDGSKVALGDLNNDGLLDVVGIGSATNTASVWYQDADGTLRSPVTYSVTHAGYEDLEVGDVNGDGLADLVVMSGQLYAVPNLGILTQAPDGTLNAPAYYRVGPNELTSGVGVGDVNGDGLQDVLVTSSRGLSAFIQTSGRLDPAVLLAPVGGSSMKVVDVNGDGRADVVLKDGFYAQGAAGNLLAKESYDLPFVSYTNTDELAVGDIDGDGRPDVAMVDHNNGLVLLHNHGSPTSGSRVAVREEQAPSKRFTGVRLRALPFRGSPSRGP